MPPRIRTKYQETIVPKLKEQFGISNPMAVPFLEKVVLNIGVGKQIEGTKLNVKAKEQVLKDLAVITGQKPVINKARKSVANFKLRAGFEVGATVTLRNEKMWGSSIASSAWRSPASRTSVASTTRASTRAATTPSASPSRASSLK